MTHWVVTKAEVKEREKGKARAALAKAREKVERETILAQERQATTPVIVQTRSSEL